MVARKKLPDFFTWFKEVAKKNILIFFSVHTFNSQKNWLYWLTDDCCLSYIRKSEKEKHLCELFFEVKKKLAS